MPDAPVLSNDGVCIGCNNLLDWTSEIGATGYRLEYNFFGGMGEQGVWTTLYDGVLLTFLHEDLVIDTKYQYRVYSYDADEDSSASNYLVVSPCCIAYTEECCGDAV